MNELIPLTAVLALLIGGMIAVRRLASVTARMWLVAVGGAVLLGLAWLAGGEAMGPKVVVTAVVLDSFYRRWREWRERRPG
jgi:hypothetical protein